MRAGRGGIECPVPGNAARYQDHFGYAATAVIPEAAGARACCQGWGQGQLLLPDASSGELEALDSCARLFARPGAQSHPDLVAWQGRGQWSPSSGEREGALTAL